MQTQTRLIPLTRWHEYHVWPPIGGLRHIRFHQSTKGFDDGVFVKVGRRVLVDEARFFECVARQNQQEGSSDA